MSRHKIGIMELTPYHSGLHLVLFLCPYLKYQNSECQGTPLCRPTRPGESPSCLTPYSVSLYPLPSLRRNNSRGPFPFPFRPIRPNPNRLNFYKNPETPYLRQGPTEYGPGSHYSIQVPPDPTFSVNSLHHPQIWWTNWGVLPLDWPEIDPGVLSHFCHILFFI